MKSYCLIVALLLPIMFAHTQNSESIQTLDSIYYYRSQANNPYLSTSQRFQFANKAIKLSETTNQDSTILKSKVVLNNIYILKADYQTLKSTNLQNIQLAESLKDSLLIAFANNNLGWAYKSLSKNDSAYYYYYKASKLFNKLQSDRNEGEVLFNMANIQFEEKDYLGAEENAITALRLIRNLPKTENNLDTLWSINNLLAIISDELGQFDKAIEYHQKALSFSDQIKDNYLYTLYSNSNIALIYKEQKQYDKALGIYKDLFNNKEILLQEPNNYALILGDYAYVKHLSNKFKTDEITSMFTEAYKMSDSLQDNYSLMSISLNASEFYKDLSLKDSALFFANRAYNLAKKTNTNDVILKSLILKSDIEEPAKAKTFLTEYVKLSDSLQNKERAIRNKFARIEFETDLIVERSKQIAKERLWLLFLSIGLIFTLLLLYIIVTQRTKNK
ncbi:MAG TPA: tetratricopeptide repeat protein, partial [Xanthomarina sp.]|nr:tetratricopeptide repeat protein [Xanthomarina sp.]